MAAMMPGMMKQNVSVPKTIVESMWRAPRGGKRRKEEDRGGKRKGCRKIGEKVQAKIIL